MIIKSINCSESIETIQPNGLKRWKKTEMSADIVEGEDEIAASLELHKKAETVNASMNPGANIQVNPEYAHLLGINTTAPSAPPIIDYKAKEKAEIDIDNATSLGELERYMNDAIRNDLFFHWKNKKDKLLAESK